jgi:vitamin B12 transporter
MRREGEGGQRSGSQETCLRRVVPRPGGVYRKQAGAALKARFFVMSDVFANDGGIMRKILYLLSVSALLPTVSQAQDGAVAIAGSEDADEDSRTLTITADGFAVGTVLTGESISIITREEIEEVQGPDIVRLLERAPGVAASRNGGIGSFTGVRVRGAEAEQLLVLVDGVRVADPASPGAGFDFGNLLPGTVGRIELLRGSNSTIWGSQAVGGVLLAETRDFEGGEASAEYGARDSLYVTAALGLAGERYGLTLAGGFFDTEGFSSAAAGTEPDGYRQWQAGARGRFALTDGLDVVASVRHADSRLEIDGFPAPSFALADTDGFQDTRESSGRIGLDYGGERLDLKASFSLSDTDRDTFDPGIGPVPTFAAQGRSERAELRGRYFLKPDTIAVAFGGEGEWTRFGSTFDAEQSAEIYGAYAQLEFRARPFALNVGARRDDHDRFGGATSLGVDAAWQLGDGWRLKASVGEGFKAPTLFQLFSSFGNTALQPEQSVSYDIGIEKGARRTGRFHAALTAFQRDSEDQVEFVSCFGVADGICTGRPFGTYDNVGQARARGVEAEATVGLLATFQAGAAYTYLEAENRTPGSANLGNKLARRPDHALTVWGEWATPLAGLSLGFDLRMVSDSFDDAGNFTPLDGYATADLRASYDLGAIALFGRVENVGDAQYQTAAGYAQAGRGAFIGVRAGY